MSMALRAITFDTGGTVLDWHGSIVDELAAVPAWQGLVFDRHEFVNEWRRLAALLQWLGFIVGVSGVAAFAVRNVAHVVPGS